MVSESGNRMIEYLILNDSFACAYGSKLYGTSLQDIVDDWCFGALAQSYDSKKPKIKFRQKILLTLGNVSIWLRTKKLKSFKWMMAGVKIITNLLGYSGAQRVKETAKGIKKVNSKSNTLIRACE